MFDGISPLSVLVLKMFFSKMQNLPMKVLAASLLGKDIDRKTFIYLKRFLQNKCLQVRELGHIQEDENYRRPFEVF